MNKKKFLTLLKKALEIKNISENDLIEFDSLNLLQIVELNDKYFNGLSIKNEKIAKCRSISDLIKLYKGKIK
jgi:acyl carrier protein|tara:strand:- start:86 stop:301 length:216 start_codon:yes stop_codon:yes gene_type:complete